MEAVNDFKREYHLADAEARYLLLELTQLLGRNAPLGLLATVVNSTILAFVLRNTAPLIFLLIWLAVVYLTAGLRYCQLGRYRLAPLTPSHVASWNKQFIILAALSGILWGMTGLFLFPGSSIEHQAFIAFVLGGMVAGAAATYAASREAFIAFTLPALLPYIARLFVIGDEIRIAMGTMALLFTVIIGIVGTKLHSTTVASLRLRFENKNYVEYLASAKERAEQLNKELVVEIEERKRGEAELQKHREHLQELVDEQTAALSCANEKLKADVAERKQMEEMLRQSREFIVRIIDTVDDGIIVVDRDYRIISANLAYCRQVNHSQEQLIGRPCHVIAHNSPTPCHDEERDCPIAGSFATGLPQTALHIHKDEEGKSLNIAIKSFPLKDSAGQIFSAIGVLSNVTEKLKVEEQMRNTQKLESLGILAGGIAHDFNNLLSGLFGYIDLARQRAVEGDSDNTAKYLAKTLAVFDRARHLTRQLLTFSKGGAPILKTQPLAAHVQKTIQFALSGSAVAASFTIPDDIWLCSFDQNQIAQVIDNIVINACQAMPLGGKLEVDISNVNAESAPSVLPPKAYVRISIQDQGCGIVPDHLPHIFEPFFTTKKEGSGLGLAISYSIVKKHQGYIEVASTGGNGTTFHIYLPAAIDDCPRVAAAKAVFHQGRGRIIIMDDEEFMLDLLSVWLNESGYDDVVTAKEGDEALALVKEAVRTGRPFILAILDLTIPGGRGGKDVVGEMVDIDPSLQVVASSGYSEDPVMSHPDAYGFTGRLIKPYRKDDLTGLLASLSVTPS